MSSFVLAPAAFRDFDEIWEYIAADSIEAADRLIQTFEEQISALCRMPGMGHKRTDLAAARNILFWPVGEYLILYRPLYDRLEVVAVVHGKRDIPEFLRRRRV